MDYQDLADLHAKLDNINDSIRYANPNNSSSSGGPILEPHQKLILFPIILSVLFVFSIILIVGRIVLLGLSGAASNIFAILFLGVGLFLEKLGFDLSGDYSVLLIFLFCGLLLLLFFSSILILTVLIIVFIVKKKKKKTKPIMYQRNNCGQDVHISPEQMAEYNRVLDEALKKEIQESLKRP